MADYNIDFAELIRHPEKMDKETLYDLRSILALYPYCQTARLLLLQNLYLLHDPSFDEELRHSAIYITDRKVLFNLVEAAHYRISPQKKGNVDAGGKTDGDRTIVFSILYLMKKATANLRKGNQHLLTPQSTTFLICLKQGPMMMPKIVMYHS